METPKLIIDRDIAAEDSFFEAVFGVPCDVFSSNMASNFLNDNKDASEIEVEIRSDGGSTSEAKITFDLLRNSGKRIITKGYKVNSSAVIPFLAGDERMISENADFVIHPVWIDANGLPFKMEANDLIEYGNMIKEEEKKLLDIYCSVIGEDKRNEVTELMAKSTNLSADDAIRLGFATGKLEAKAESSTENKRAVSFNNKMAALVIKNKSNQNQKEMEGLNDNLKTLNGTITAFLNKVGIKTNNQETETENKETETLNASVELSEGGSIYFDGELSEGVAVFSDEAMESPLADGDHALADGRVVSVAEGVVSAVAAASSEETETEDSTETETQNSEVEELKNEVSKLSETVNTQAESINTIAETLKNMTPAFDALKNLVPGDTGGEATSRKKVQNKVLSAAEYANLSAVEKKRYNQSKR